MTETVHYKKLRFVAEQMPWVRRWGSAVSSTSGWLSAARTFTKDALSMCMTRCSRGLFKAKVKEMPGESET